MFHYSKEATHSYYRRLTPVNISPTLSQKVFGTISIVDISTSSDTNFHEGMSPYSAKLPFSGGSIYEGNTSLYQD